MNHDIAALGVQIKGQCTFVASLCSANAPFKGQLRDKRYAFQLPRLAAMPLPHREKVRNDFVRTRRSTLLCPAITPLLPVLLVVEILLTAGDLDIDAGHCVI